jgi:hypothetical protein
MRDRRGKQCLAEHAMQADQLELRAATGNHGRHTLESSPNAPLDSTHRSSRTGPRTSGWRRLR